MRAIKGSLLGMRAINTARHLSRLVLRQAQDEVLMLSLSKHEAAQTYDFICRAV